AWLFDALAAQRHATPEVVRIAELLRGALHGRRTLSRTRRQFEEQLVTVNRALASEQLTALLYADIRAAAHDAVLPEHVRRRGRAHAILTAGQATRQAALRRIRVVECSAAGGVTVFPRGYGRDNARTLDVQRAIPSARPGLCFYVRGIGLPAHELFVRLASGRALRTSRVTLAARRERIVFALQVEVASGGGWRCRAVPLLVGASRVVEGLSVRAGGASGAGRTDTAGSAGLRRRAHARPTHRAAAAGHAGRTRRGAARGTTMRHLRGTTGRVPFGNSAAADGKRTSHQHQGAEQRMIRQWFDPRVHTQATRHPEWATGPRSTAPSSAIRAPWCRGERSSTRTEKNFARTRVTSDHFAIDTRIFECACGSIVGRAVIETPPVRHHLRSNHANPPAALVLSALSGLAGLRFERPLEGQRSRRWRPP